MPAPENLFAKFLARNGRQCEKDECAELGLIAGKSYKVKFLEIDSFTTRLQLVEYPERVHPKSNVKYTPIFNSVMFDFHDIDGTEVDIFDNPNWNAWHDLHTKASRADKGTAVPASQGTPGS